MTVNILGTPYEIIVKKYDEEDAFERRSIGAFCDGFTKKIVLCDMNTYKGWEYEEKTTIDACNKANLRHEIVHAFFNESGLQDNTFGIDNSWAKNEEMVDWISIQGEKIYKAWREANAL